MTGKELIMYILANNLENEPVFKDGKLIGFETEGKFAEAMNVGVATVRAWVDTGMIGYSIRIGDVNYIPAIYMPIIKA
jgi:hypothetical protein